MRPTLAAVLLALELLSRSYTHAFTLQSLIASQKFIPTRRCNSFLHAKKKKKKGGGGGAAAGVKGFGGATTTFKANTKVKMDRSKDTLAFYDYMEKNGGAGENLKRVALGYFPLPNGGELRGVVALRDIKKGDVIINIPYEMAVNLGPEGEDPTLPALELLTDYADTLRSDNDSAYFKLLPPFMGNDCLGSTDFFSDAALEALQSPLVVEETLNRRERTRARFGDKAGDLPTWIDGTPMTEEHLQWAVWLITSRVLTVQGNPEEGKSYRLLIPFLDMCNHDRSSPHVLTGRAMPDGELKVVAGENVAAGDQINICYGGGVAGNDRFLQDYGFLDSATAAFDLVAQQLLGKRRMVEGASAGKNIAIADMERTLDLLRTTTIEQDEALLENERDSALRSALEYRLGLKRALAKYVVMS